jgi:hypothetical protein
LKPYLEKNITGKKGWWSGSRCPEFKPSTAKKKKKKVEDGSATPWRH